MTAAQGWAAFAASVAAVLIAGALAVRFLARTSWAAVTEWQALRQGVDRLADLAATVSSVGDQLAAHLADHDRERTP